MENILSWQIQMHALTEDIFDEMKESNISNLKRQRHVSTENS